MGSNITESGGSGKPPSIKVMEHFFFVLKRAVMAYLN